MLFLEDSAKFEGTYKEIISVGLKPDLHTYTSRAKLAVRKKDDALVESIIKEVQNVGLQMNRHMLIVLLDHAANKGDLDEFKRLHEEAKKAGWLNQDSVINALGNGYLQFRAPDQTLIIFDEALAAKIHLTSSTYAVAMQAAARVQDVQKLEEYNFSSSANKIFKTTDMINALIEGYQRGGNFDNSWKAYDRLINSKIMRPNQRTFIQILNACGFSGKGEKIPEIIQHIQQKGVKYSLQMYASLIKAHMLNRNIASAVQVLLEMPKAGYEWDGRHRNAFIVGLKKGDYPDSIEEAVTQLFANKGEKTLTPEDSKSLEIVAKSLQSA